MKAGGSPLLVGHASNIPRGRSMVKTNIDDDVGSILSPGIRHNPLSSRERTHCIFNQALFSTVSIYKVVATYSNTITLTDDPICRFSGRLLA